MTLGVGLRGGGALFHFCGYNGYGAPQNWGGSQLPRTGEAYVNIMLWLSHAYGIPLEGNFVGAPLIHPLTEGSRYQVEFYISLLDSMLFATNRIGVHFSQWQPEDNTLYLLGLEPQVQYTDSAFLVEKEGWMKISGSFIAEGGENFFSIGNFDGYDGSDSLYVGNGGVPWPNGTSNWDAAYYYLDDVSVVEDTSYHVGVQEVDQRDIELRVYPNPTKQELNVSIVLGEGEEGVVSLRNHLGVLVMSHLLHNGTNTLKVSSLSSGIYHYRVTINGESKNTGKQVILR